jgi:hypothetical protein
LPLLEALLLPADELEDELDNELLEEELDELEEELLEEASLSLSESLRLCATARGAAAAAAFWRGGFSTIPPNFPFAALAEAVFAGVAGLAGGVLLLLLLPLLLPLLPLLLLLLPPLLLEVELDLDEEDELLLSETERPRLLLTGAAIFFATGFGATAFLTALTFAGTTGPASAANFLCRYSTFSSKVTTSDALAGMSFSMALHRCTATARNSKTKGLKCGQ